jgi:hypothetical protein
MRAGYMQSNVLIWHLSPEHYMVRRPSLLFSAIVTAGMLFCATGAAHAQRWTWDVGVTGGYSSFTSFLGEGDTGLSGTPGSSVMWRGGLLGGLQVTYNVDKRFGVRLNSRYAERAVTGSDLAGVDFVSATNLWTASLDLLLRLRQPRDEFTGSELLPYATVGLGVQSTNPGNDGFTCTDIQRSESFACVPIVTGGPVGSANSRSWALREQTSPMALLGVGADVRFTRELALRAELSDQIFKAPVYRAEQVSTTDWNLPSNTSQSKLVHGLGFTVGLHLFVGARVPSVIVTIAPPETIRAVDRAGEIELCPETVPIAVAPFRNAPLRFSIEGTPQVVRQHMQDVLAGAAYQVTRSDNGATVTSWSSAYAHPDDRSAQRRHAFHFEFVLVEGSTDLIVRWLVCSRRQADARWVASDDDRFARPADLDQIVAAIRNKRQ